jgi:predicted transposase YbfD/YdcC
MHIRELFANKIDRHIEEVIKVDQTDDDIVREEIREYVVTDSICRHYQTVLDRYRETPQNPHEGIGVWVSGFFGSGKSSFAKNLGLAIENRDLKGEGAAFLLGKQAGDEKIQVLFSNITEHIPTQAVIFDISTDRGIRSGNQTLTEITYRLFLERLGYAKDLDLSELEITLEGEGRLERFKETFQNIYNKEWDREKGKVAFAISWASRVLHEMEPATWTTPDSWSQGAKNRADISPNLLAERCKLLMDRRRPGKSLVFVIDEVGQFVARDIQKMLDLAGLVQSLGRVGRGKIWMVVTSQEQLNELVGGLDDRRVELARLMDRFPLQVHLEPSDISEVTSKRILSKNAAAQKTLREIFSTHRGRLTENTRMSADIALPELTTEAFADLYPMLPYQIDLIIQIVSGLRTQGGAARHVGGANRTIIKLAQQLLIHPETNLAEKPIGTLASIDQIYDLVSGNISSEIRGKISSIKKDLPDYPLAQPVAKAICLLQFVKSVHRTAENIAAALHTSVDADSRLPEVRAALEALKKAHKVREGDDGFRIPTPAEDDWERIRLSLPTPKFGEISRIHADIIHGFWQPQPSHNLLDTKLFKAGLTLNGRAIEEGDILVHMALADAGKEFEEKSVEMRRRSQTETAGIFWTIPIDDAIDRETVEIFRSREMLSRKERGAQTRDESALAAEEKIRLRRHEDELKRLLRQACLSGAVYFRGNDRSPKSGIDTVKKAVESVMANALPDVFHRFGEAAARVRKQDLDSLMTTENLRGLSPVFASLHLLKDEGGQVVFNTDQNPLAEVLARIKNRTDYGENASGKYLETEFAKEPFGWEFEVVRVLSVCLLRAGAIEATSKGLLIESALSMDAKTTFSNNNLFRQTSFRPKTGIDFTELLKANENVKDVFGGEIPDLNQSVVAETIRIKTGECEKEVQDQYQVLATHALPGSDILSDACHLIRAIRTGSEEQAISSFNSSCKELKEAVKRAAELAQQLTEPALADVKRAKKVIRVMWPFLSREPDLDPGLTEKAENLIDLLKRETFFKELPTIDQLSRDLETEYTRRFEEAAGTRKQFYSEALEHLANTPGWEKLTEDQQGVIREPLAQYAAVDPDLSTGIPQLRADIDAATNRFNKAVEEMMRLLDGARIIRVNVSSFFSGGVETEEQLDAALAGLREECERHIGAGKKVLIQ